MSGPVSRLTLPENFNDITSSMLLMKPEPQYLAASLWKRAMAASLSVPASFGLNGREFVAGGDAYKSAAADRLTIASELFDALIAAKFDLKGQPGHTVRVNRPVYADTTYTKVSRKLATAQTISTTAIAIGSEQNDITLGRYAGPYDQVNSRVAPFGIERFDASMGVHNVIQAVGSHLQRDYDKFLDSTLLKLATDGAANVIRPSGMSADDDASAATQFPLDYDTINRAETTLDNANAPVFGDGYRIAMLTPNQCRQLKSDPLFAKYAEKHAEYNALFPGYLTTVNKFHIFKCTTLDQAVNSSSIAINKGLILAPSAFMGAMGEKPRVATSSDDNFAETVKAIWIAYMESELADNTFVVSVRSSA